MFLMASVRHNNNSLCIINIVLQRSTMCQNTNGIKKRPVSIVNVAAVQRRLMNQTIQPARNPVIVNQPGKSHGEHFY